MEMSVQEGTFHINGVQVDGIKKLELKKSKDDLNDGIYTKLDNFKASGIFKDIKLHLEILRRYLLKYGMVQRKHCLKFILIIKNLES